MISFPSLRRITTGQHYLPQVDGLRCAAILPVLLLHLLNVMSDELGAVMPHPMNPLWLGITRGVNGVYLFFAISGFILGLPFARHALRGAHPVYLPKYFLRRVTRLEPPFMLSVLMIFLIKVSFSHLYARHTSLGFLWPHLLATLTYTHLLIYRTHSLISGPTWSLEIEIQFYCLMPLLASAYLIRNTTLRRCLFLLAIVISGASAWYWQNSYLITCTIFGFFSFFLAGLLMADLYVTGDIDWFAKEHRLGWRLGLDGLALLLWPASFLLPVRITALLLPFVLMLLFLSAMRGWLGPKIFGLAPISIIGGMCYTIYLYQFLVFSSASLLLRRLAWMSYGHLYLCAAAFLIPALLIFSIILYLLVERPCMNPNWPGDLLSLAGKNTPRPDAT